MLIATPLGTMIALADDTALLLLDFHDRRGMADALARFGSPGDVEPNNAASSILNKTSEQLATYFEGRLKTFDLPLRPEGTAYQQAVWQSLLKIPFGQTLSYARQAKTLHPPSVARAVARANGQNFLSIVIPCHRVIGSDGSLTGYGGNLSRKQWLIHHEQAVMDQTRMPSTLFAAQTPADQVAVF